MLRFLCLDVLVGAYEADTVVLLRYGTFFVCVSGLPVRFPFGKVRYLLGRGGGGGGRLGLHQ